LLEKKSEKSKRNGKRVKKKGESGNWGKEREEVKKSY
jgi:hypothetical protein